MAILPHGILLAVEEHDLAVAIASTNAREQLGIEHERLLGASISVALATPGERELRELAATAQLDRSNPIAATTHDGRHFAAIVHRSDGLLVIELEPATSHLGVGCLDGALQRLEAAPRPGDAARVAAVEIQSLLGFAKVALYRQRGGMTELASVGVDDGAPPPAIDFDGDESVRSVPDRTATAVPLAAIAGRTLSLARCILRAPSPSPATGALFAIKLGTWGQLVCQHPVPHFTSYSARCAAQAIARVLAWHLSMRDTLGDELRVSNMAKDEFLAAVSHELRTPLNAMLGWLRLIEAGQVTPDRNGQALATVTRNAHALAGLVEELLDVSRVITGKMRVELQPTSIAIIVEAALASVQPTADAKGITIRADLDTQAGPVLADASRMQQVVWNLLANAIKFTGEGGTITVALRRAGGVVEIDVTDTGTGIDPSVLPFVFERFRQGDNAMARAQGLGLGLAIVRHLVELHGGDVSATSAGLGHGSTFVVRLPVAMERISTTHPAVQAPPTFEPAPQLRGIRVLAVDDEQDANDLVRAVLQSSQVDVVTTSSVTEALTLLDQLDPHILISDIGMPGVDGYAFIQEVRKARDPKKSRIPAIAITAFARPQDRSRAFLAGFDVYLAKPIDPTELTAVLCNLADRRSTPPGRPAESDGKPSGTLAETRILVVDDDVDNAAMLAIILELEGATVDQAHTASDGMARIKSFRPHVLVSDITLPDKDGFAFVRELRATGSDEGGWIPAISVSGHGDPDTAREAILAGFQLHMTKPIDPSDLIARLARLVGRTLRRT